MRDLLKWKLEVTPEFLTKTECEWSKIAGEPITVEHIKGALYAFGSERAILRLAHKMRSLDVHYWVSRRSWYWVKELQFHE
jgi:hypothetical protein